MNAPLHAQTCAHSTAPRSPHQSPTWHTHRTRSMPCAYSFESALSNRFAALVWRDTIPGTPRNCWIYFMRLFWQECSCVSVISFGVPREQHWVAKCAAAQIRLEAIGLNVFSQNRSPRHNIGRPLRHNEQQACFEQLSPIPTSTWALGWPAWEGWDTIKVVDAEYVKRVGLFCSRTRIERRA